MVMIPKTVKELRDYLDTYPDTMPIKLLEECEGAKCTHLMDFMVETEERSIRMSFGEYTETVLVIKSAG